MQYIHKRLKIAEMSDEHDRHITQRAGNIPFGVIFQRKPPPKRTLRPHAKLQYGSSPISAFQIDAYAELSLSHEMNPSDSITIPTIPSKPQTRRMIAPPILPSISLTSNAIHKPFFILRTLRCPLMLLCSRLSGAYIGYLPFVEKGVFAENQKCLLAKAWPLPDLR
jgi:hypothetical protein